MRVNDTDITDAKVTRSRLTCCADALCNLPAAGQDVVQALTCS